MECSLRINTIKRRAYLAIQPGFELSTTLLSHWTQIVRESVTSVLCSQNQPWKLKVTYWTHSSTHPDNKAILEEESEWYMPMTTTHKLSVTTPLFSFFHSNKTIIIIWAQWFLRLNTTFPSLSCRSLEHVTKFWSMEYGHNFHAVFPGTQPSFMDEGYSPLALFLYPSSLMTRTHTWHQNLL